MAGSYRLLSVTQVRHKTASAGCPLYPLLTILFRVVIFQLYKAAKQDNFTTFQSKLLLRKYTELQLLLLLHISALDTVMYSENYRLVGYPVDRFVITSRSAQTVLCLFAHDFHRPLGFKAIV
jgi:hypothetical protein